jgi:hypothetical protein
MFLAKMRLLKYRKYKAGLIIYREVSNWFIKRKIRRRLENWNARIIQRLVRGKLGRNRFKKLKKWNKCMSYLAREVKNK